MNLLLWVLQVFLAFESFAGGAYKVFAFDEMAKASSAISALPRGGWGAIGVLEMLLAVLLVVPGVTKWKPVLTPIAATVLAVESLGLAGLYGHYSLQVAATNPMVYVVIGGLMAAFVAYGRYMIRPQA